MDYGRITEKIMFMDEASWKRHANPWSVWTRVPILPLLALAIYSRAWWGWWSLVPTAVLVVWMWRNPRVFREPKSVDNWASKGTFGERIWLNRSKIAIPSHHARAASILSVFAVCGTLVVIYGLAFLEAWAVATGVVIAVGAKMWFVDRMVWLFEDMKHLYPGMNDVARDTDSSELE